MDRIRFFTISGQFDNVSVTNLKAMVKAAAGTYTNLWLNANDCLSDKYPSVTVAQPDPIVIDYSYIPIDLKSQTKGSY